MSRAQRSLSTQRYGAPIHGARSLFYPVMRAGRELHAPVNQHHFLWHIGERPEGCHHRPRCCLLKECQRLFWSRRPQARYCSESCRQAARQWRCWQASRRYRATDHGRERRREQAQRYRQRLRERQTASADEGPPREGQRPAPACEDFSTRPCDRPGCYELFALPHERSCKRFAVWRADWRYVECWIARRGIGRGVGACAVSA